MPYNLRPFIFTLILSLCCQLPATCLALTIMPLGDSITKGFHAPRETRGSYRLELQRLFQSAAIDFDYVGEFTHSREGLADGDHQAVAGYRIEQMTSEFGPAISSYQPDIVLVLAGTNNHWDDPDFTTFVNKYDALVSMIHDASPQSRIIMSTVPKFGCCRSSAGYWTPYWVDARNQFVIPNMNAAISSVVDTYSFVDLVDLYSELDPATDLSWGDWVHPNIYGHQKLANLFFHAMVPEPSTATLSTLAVCLIGVMRRRRSPRV